MNKPLMFVQCILHSVDGKILTVWIPEKYAFKDKILKLKNDNKEWDDGWKVFHVFSDIKKTEKEANIDAEAWKHQREVSDI